MIITRKRKFHKPIITFEGAQIPLAKSLTVLGLSLDKNLNFQEHIRSKHKKAIKLFQMVSRAASASWGLNSHILRTIYMTVVEPTILYAANVWAGGRITVIIRRRLIAITRIFAIRIAKAHRTTSAISSALLAGILPLDLRATEQARLYLIKKGGTIYTLPGKKMEKRINPFRLSHPAYREHKTFVLIHTSEDLKELEKDAMQIFTDGSKMEGRVGAAATMWHEGLEKHQIMMRLENYCTVFQAEMVAILSALEYVVINRLPNEHYSLLSDSRSALQSICDPNSLHPLAVAIRNQIDTLKLEGKSVKIAWIKSHTGLAGNERADELAKKAALSDNLTPSYDNFTLSYAKRTIRAATIDEWQLRFDEVRAGSAIKLFYNNVRQAHRTIACTNHNNLRSQLLTGHGGVKSYLHRFKLAADPFCVCDGDSEETIEHIITKCPRFTMSRVDCEHRMDITISNATIAEIMINDRLRNTFLEYCETVMRSAARANGSIA